MSELVLFERAMLESVLRGNKDLRSIQIDVKLPTRLIENVIDVFKEKGWISGSIFDLSCHEEKMKNAICPEKSSHAIPDELLEILSLTVEDFLDTKSNLHRFKKVWMTSLEKKILESHLKNLSEFIQSLEGRKDKKLHELEYIFWGVGNYGSLLKKVSEEA